MRTSAGDENIPVATSWPPSTKVPLRLSRSVTLKRPADPSKTRHVYARFNRHPRARRRASPPHDDILGPDFQHQGRRPPRGEDDDNPRLARRLPGTGSHAVFAGLVRGRHGPRITRALVHAEGGARPR